MNNIGGNHDKVRVSFKLNRDRVGTELLVKDVDDDNSNKQQLKLNNDLETQNHSILSPISTRSQEKFTQLPNQISSILVLPKHLEHQSNSLEVIPTQKHYETVV